MKVMDKPWFGRKLIGWGWGVPLRWEGWATILIYFLLIWLTVLCTHSRGIFILLLIILTALLFSVAYRTSGKPQWGSLWCGKQIINLKPYIFGLILGISLSIIIFISNVLLPNSAPDSSPGTLFLAFLIGSYIVWTTHLTNNTAVKNAKKALLVGFFTSFIGFSFSMVTFIVVDNVFLNIVSKQSDKIINFQNGHYSSMREMINIGLLRGVLFGLPASGIFGLACGYIGRKLSRTKLIVFTIAIGIVLVLNLGISQMQYLEKAHTTFQAYYTFRGCVQLLEKTEKYGICRLPTGKTIKMVLFHEEWHLNGDVPCGFLCF